MTPTMYRDDEVVSASLHLVYLGERQNGYDQGEQQRHRRRDKSPDHLQRNNETMYVVINT